MTDRHRTIVDVHVLLLRPGGKVLMMERANTGYADGEAGLPSGHLEQGETVMEAAIREVKEEVGVAVDPADLRCVHVNHRRKGDEEARIGFFFSATRWSGEPANREPHKCARIWWADLDDPPAETVAYIADILRRIRQGAEPFSVYGWGRA